MLKKSITILTTFVSRWSILWAVQIIISIATILASYKLAHHKIHKNKHSNSRFINGTNCSLIFYVSYHIDILNNATRIGCCFRWHWWLDSSVYIKIQESLLSGKLYSLTYYWFSDPKECFEILFNTTLNTPAEPYFLSILQHLLSIRDDVFARLDSRLCKLSNLSVCVFE
jgi:Diaphanous FH3 Domain